MIHGNGVTEVLVDLEADVPQVVGRKPKFPGTRRLHDAGVEGGDELRGAEFHQATAVDGGWLDRQRLLARFVDDDRAKSRELRDGPIAGVGNDSFELRPGTFEIKR